MKKITKIFIGVFLTCFSFYYTNKIIDISKSKDPIMMEIIKNKKDYDIAPVNAILEDTYIIPGTSGKEIDVEQSYEKMKKLGSYNKNLLVYKDISPVISVKKTYDKYIIKGNNKLHSISLIITLDDKTVLNDIIKVLKNNNTSVTFFITDDIIEKDLVEKIITDNEIESLGSNYSYKNIKNTNNYLKQFTNKKLKYCYVKDNNNETLNICKENKMHTIKPIITNNKNPYYDIKNNLENGNIISLQANTYLKNQLDVIIKYINQKGYEIKLLDELLEE